MDNKLINKLIEKYPCEEVSSFNFYRDLFPVGSFERKGNFKDEKVNGIIIEVTSEKKQNGKDLILRHTLTDELDKIEEVCSRDNFCLMSPVGYMGKSRENKNAREIYAIAIDVDGIDTEKQFEFLMLQCAEGHDMRAFIWGVPKPTYIVSSGTGIHLYYVFKKPILAFPNVVKELEKLKKRITWQAWTQGASSLSKKIQYESIFQGFRVVGTRTKKGDIARVYRYEKGDKVSIDDLNYYVPVEHQATNLQYKSELSLEQAKKKYPKWYETRIEKKQAKGSWTCKVDLYNWWIEKVKAGAEQGHRYWSIMTLATYAVKCDVPYEKLVEDSLELREELESRGDAFTVDDVMRALEAYNSSYITYPIHTIVDRTGIPIKRNKRNGRKQADHLVIMNKMKEVKRLLGEKINEGRPSARADIENAYKNNPNATVNQICEITGFKKSVVYKYKKELI